MQQCMTRAAAVSHVLSFNQDRDKFLSLIFIPLSWINSRQVDVYNVCTRHQTIEEFGCLN